MRPEEVQEVLRRTVLVTIDAATGTMSSQYGPRALTAGGTAVKELVRGLGGPPDKGVPLNEIARRLTAAASHSIAT